MSKGPIADLVRHVFIMAAVLVNFDFSAAKFRRSSSQDIEFTASDIKVFWDSSVGV
jgi:hypothetical protein